MNQAINQQNFRINEWFPKQPKGWQVKPLWTVSQNKSVQGASGEMLSVYLDRGVIRASEGDLGTHAVSLDLSNYQKVEPGDFILNNQQAWRGSVGVSFEHGIISPAYIILRLSDEFEWRFANYLLRTKVITDQFMLASRGVGSIQRQVHSPSLRKVLVIIPPLDEQKTIANFLDEKINVVDKLITQKERLINSLQKKRAAVISHAVTKGLDPNAKFKDSGVEWLGKIPSDWKLVPMRELFFEKKEVIGTNSNQYTLLGLTTKGVRQRNIEDASGKHPANYDTYQVVQPGDLLMCLFDYDVTPRTVGYVTQSGMVTGAYTRLEPKRNVVAKFYYYLFLFLDQNKELLHLCTGLRNTIPNHIFWPLPNPKPSEVDQKRIVGFLDEETEKVDRAVSLIGSQMGKLKEYRTSLIYSAVTGKIKI